MMMTVLLLTLLYIIAIHDSVVRPQQSRADDDARSEDEPKMTTSGNKGEVKIVQSYELPLDRARSQAAVAMIVLGTCATAPSLRRIHCRVRACCCQCARETDRFFASAMRLRRPCSTGELDLRTDTRKCQNKAAMNRASDTEGFVAKHTEGTEQNSIIAINDYTY